MIKAIVHESNEDHQFYIRLESENGETWFTSEGYTRRSDAQRSILDFFKSLGSNARISNGNVILNAAIVNLDTEGHLVG